MDIHKNARLTPKGRERIVRQVLSGQTPKAAAFAVGVCPRTVRKWLTRYSIEGLAGLEDRSSRPRRLRQPTPLEVIEKIERLRRQRLTGKSTSDEHRTRSRRLPSNLLHSSGNPALRKPSNTCGRFGVCAIIHLMVSLGKIPRASANAVFASSILPSSA